MTFMRVVNDKGCTFNEQLVQIGLAKCSHESIAQNNDCKHAYQKEQSLKTK